MIVPCGQKKIWDKSPKTRSSAAKVAYVGSPFVVNKAYAKHFSDSWIILSAKYGFIEPEFKIPKPYNVTFKRPSTNPVSTDVLRRQVAKLKLNRFKNVIGLGGKDYRAAISQAFSGTPVKLHFPFAGLSIGRMLQATKRAITGNHPFNSKKRTLQCESVVERNFGTGKVCEELHKWLSCLQSLTFPFDMTRIPRNGIYVLLEDGEIGHGGNRIVRVGTHTGENQLRSRLVQHFVHENKDRSIFRKNIGRCLLNKNNDPFVSSWELDLTTKAAKAKYKDQIDFEKQKQIEVQVTAYLRKRLRVVVLEIPTKADRLRMESRIISTVSLCPSCGPSTKWLGNHSTKAKIRESGLWQVNELNKTPFCIRDVAVLVKQSRLA